MAEIQGVDQSGSHGPICPAAGARILLAMVGTPAARAGVRSIMTTAVAGARLDIGLTQVQALPSSKNPAFAQDTE